jgi:chemotaxis protein histidine kinase CheA
VTSEIFFQRIAAVRERFVAKLETRIGEIESTVPRLQHEDSMEALARVHRHAHDLCGVGPTMGFVATGKAARQVEQILLAALKANRSLTADEVARVTESVARLRAAAQSESQSAAS